MFNGARILVAPLDWGLGHAARCVPIIHRVIDQGAVPVIGADAGALALLRQEFPDLEYVQMVGVEVRYSKGNNQFWSLARQFPGMIRSVRAEHALFDRIRQRLRIDAVISDQRFGLRSPDLPSVLITHQVFPFTPFAQGALRTMNRNQIECFDRCWIMDEARAPGLAGELSHGSDLPANARYIGTVSRMSFTPALSAGEGGRPLTAEYQVVAVISGPEPQRTIFELLLIEQLHALPGRHLLVLGLPGSDRDEVIGNLTIRAHMSSGDLAAAMISARLVVSRSGYTSLMDLDAIGRTALIIPTPGQPEQEYLATLHARTRRFIVQQQGTLDLVAALALLPTEPSLVRASGPDLLEQALEDLASLLR
ncbi:MAG: glycosyl transferase family 28 [Flavobacteriales bacterium]|nr:glycosyl transferase family 28 [Flavobacteriales bacterium]